MEDALQLRIGEVAELVGVKPHVLRAWERAVPTICPGKAASKQRRYRRRDVELFREIDRLLHHEGYTLKEVRQKLAPAHARKGAGEFVHTTQSLAAAVDAAAQCFDDCDPVPIIVGASVIMHTTAMPAHAAVAMEMPTTTYVAAENLARVRAGLETLIRMAGEEP